MAPFTAQIITASPEETIEAGRLLGKCLSGGEVIAYRGGLGAGKTTFTRGLALGMGLEDKVCSPTFAIVNEYHGKGRLSLYHFDMYRISGGEALETTGFFDYMSEDAVIAAEWSENIEGELDSDTVTVELAVIENGGRRITLTDPKGGNRFAGAWDRHIG